MLMLLGIDMYLNMRRSIKKTYTNIHSKTRGTLT